MFAPAPSSADEHGFVPEVRAENNRAADAPQLNPSPSAWLEIHGHKEANLEVWLQMMYSTTSLECRARSVAGLVGGAPEVPQTVSERTRVPPEEADFTLRIPLDRFLPGSCGWAPAMLFDAEFMPTLAQGPGNWVSRAQFTPTGDREFRLVETCSLRQFNPNAAVTTHCIGQRFGVPKLSATGASIEMTIGPVQDKR